MGFQMNKLAPLLTVCIVFSVSWSSQAFAIYNPSLCEQLMTDIPRVHTGPTLSYDLRDQAGHVQGLFSVTLTEDRLSVTSADGEVSKENRSKGTYRQLVAKFMADQPQVRTIDAQLLGSNLLAYQEAFAATGDSELAFQATPLYRVFAPHGFSEIQVLSPESGDIFVVFRRPPEPQEIVPASF